MKLDHLPFSAATTRRDFRTRRDFFASMETVFEHENGLKSRLVVAAEDGNCLLLNFTLLDGASSKCNKKVLILLDTECKPL